MVKPTADKQQVSDNERNNDIKFKGVRKRKWGKWVSEIRLPNSRERIWLGSYDTPEKAARAFDAALYCLRGKQAKFNFPDTPPEIAGGRSLKREEIQAVAAKFANEKQLTSSSSSSSSLEPEQKIHHTNNNLDQFNYSSSTSMSDLTNLDWPFLDYSMMTGSDCSTPDFGNFGGIDDFAGDFLAPELNMDVNYDEDDEFNCQDCSQSSFLWNF